jgi:hypothetical protein
VSAYAHELVEDAEIGPPPSKAGVKSFKLYREVLVNETLTSVTHENTALAFNGFERKETRTAKVVLTQYIVARHTFGSPRVTQYNEHVNNSKRALLFTVDFIIDIDLCAERALAHRPALLRLFTVLMMKERGKRLNEFAAKHPKTFNDLLFLLGKELVRLKWTNRAAYMRVTR